MSNFEERIYLTGFMGSGKSTIGPILGNVLGYSFVDLDDAIEAKAGKPVRHIFAEEGEAVFRALEASAMRETGNRQRLVVALGGGALTIEENLVWALDHGIVIYLRVPVKQLVQRLRRSRTVRPLLRDASGRLLSATALRDKVAALMDRREPFYLQAHLVVDVDDLRVGLTVDKVVQALRQYRRE